MISSEDECMISNDDECKIACKMSINVHDFHDDECMISMTMKK
jgi:hypothetical protein